MRRVLLTAALLLAACGERAEEPGPAAPLAAAPAAGEPAPSRVPAGPTGFVGRWGPDPSGCAHSQYVLTRTALEAHDGTFCSFQRAAETDTGWDIDATCGARERGAPAKILLERLGDGLRVRISGREPVTLRLCPENWAARPAAAAKDPNAPLDRAAAINARIAAKGGVRPYEFKHQGVIHDAWRENDQVLKIVEKVADDSGAMTGEVVWYFAPGAEEPFLVREPMAAFAFERGRLVTWFDEAGRVLADVPERDRAAREARLIARGRALRLAADG
ncbi:MAG TPA: hypothetical protein VF699_09210 [Caulobacteraceae bacterium]